ncbi:MAG: TrkA family potassium uptake protein [Hornefia sp.]|nr:TrkA family potassium uptake protein [Hornefia sp.]
MRSVLVIGLGHFGSNLAETLEKQGNEVMAIDIDENAVNKVAPYVTAAQIGDCTNELVIEDLDVEGFDICFVCISKNLETALVITTLLNENNSKKVVAKVHTEIHAKLLLKNGAADVVYPDKDMAIRTAMKYSADKAFDYVELNENYGIFEVETPENWIGYTLSDIGVRKNYKVNIIAYKNGSDIVGLDREAYIFKPDDHLIIAGNRLNFNKLIAKNLK